MPLPLSPIGQTEMRTHSWPWLPRRENNAWAIRQPPLAPSNGAHWGWPKHSWFQLQLLSQQVFTEYSLCVRPSAGDTAMNSITVDHVCKNAQLPVCHRGKEIEMNIC